MDPDQTYLIHCSLRLLSNTEGSARQAFARAVLQWIRIAPHEFLTEVDDGSGEMPLHAAIKLLTPSIGEELNIVRALAELYPDAISLQNKGGETPIDLLMAKGFDSTIVSFFATLKPEALSEKNAEGDTPLHRACYQGAGDLTIAIELARKDPNQLACPNKAGYTPAHLLCSERPREFLRFMENVFPPNVHMIQGIRVDNLLPRLFCFANRAGEYPLHTFLRNGGIGSDLVAAALKILWCYPSAASQQSTIDGATPLHLASRFHAYSPDLLSELVRVCEGALQVSDKNGQYPIHHLFQFDPVGLNVSIETYDHNVSVCQLWPIQVVEQPILETFIERFPLSIWTDDIYGQTPLYYATKMVNDLVRKQPLQPRREDALVHVLTSVDPLRVLRFLREPALGQL